MKYPRYGAALPALHNRLTWRQYGRALARRVQRRLTLTLPQAEAFEAAVGALAVAAAVLALIW